MVTVNVSAGQSVLEGYVKTPARGLCELIWNAFDADSRHVVVTGDYNGIGGLEEITVTDDGDGMNLERAEMAFSRVGDSWKILPGTRSNSGERVVHGRYGRGRYAAFSLGNFVRWRSVSEGVERGQLGGISVTGRRSSLSSFDISAYALVPSDTAGTVVTIAQPSAEAVRAFDDLPGLRQQILTEFALHLQRYQGFAVTVMGQELDSQSAIEKQNVLNLAMPEGVPGSATLTIIEWSLNNVRRAVYLCDSEDRVVDEVEARVQAPGIEFTAYLKWSGFDGREPIGLEDDTDSDTGRLISVARDALREFVGDASRRSEAKKIKQWQDEGVYPFKGSPETALDKATRATFDLIAMAASRTVDETKSTSTKALSLRLLKQTLENDPESLLPILQEVVNLPRNRIEELSELLKNSSLSQLIQVGREVGNRIEFLSGLGTILFDRQIKSRLLERRQLHRILVHETWIFGEEWALTGDDQRLTVVLAKFLKHLGVDVELATLKPVLREDGKDAIPDLVLGRQSRNSADHLEHLVVELKRPKHKLTDEDITQLRSYASAIVNDEMFDQPNVTWEFWLVGNEVTQLVDEQRRSAALPFGCVQSHPKYKIMVKTWAEIISASEHRLKFVQESLQYETSHDQGLNYLRTRYKDYLPDAALDLGEGQGADGDEDSEEAS